MWGKGEDEKGRSSTLLGLGAAQNQGDSLAMSGKEEEREESATLILSDRNTTVFNGSPKDIFWTSYS